MANSIAICPVPLPAGACNRLDGCRDGLGPNVLAVVSQRAQGITAQEVDRHARCFKLELASIGERDDKDESLLI